MAAGEDARRRERLCALQFGADRTGVRCGAHRRAAGEHHRPVALAHRDLRGVGTGGHRHRLHLFALVARVAVVGRDAAGLEPCTPPQTVEQRRELAEVGRPLDGAAAEPQLLRGGIVVDGRMVVVGLRLEHVGRLAPRSLEGARRIGRGGDGGIECVGHLYHLVVVAAVRPVRPAAGGSDRRRTPDLGGRPAAQTRTVRAGRAASSRAAPDRGRRRRCGSRGCRRRRG